MEKPDNTPFGETEKTVIFLHSEVSFEIDRKIKDNAYFIKKSAYGGRDMAHYQ
jgi:hypothetical protein